MWLNTPWVLQGVRGISREWYAYHHVLSSSPPPLQPEAYLHGGCAANLHSHPRLCARTAEWLLHCTSHFGSHGTDFPWDLYHKFKSNHTFCSAKDHVMLTGSELCIDIFSHLKRKDGLAMRMRWDWIRYNMVRYNTMGTNKRCSTFVPIPVRWLQSTSRTFSSIIIQM